MAPPHLASSQNNKNETSEEDIMLRCNRNRLRWAVAALVTLFAGAMAHAQSGVPIRIGFSMSLTGGNAANGKPSLVAMQIWEQDINAKGGLLGRPVKLVYYDDQSNASLVPGIYTKLLDVDKVDLIVSGSGTTWIAPAMPVAMQKNKLFIGMLGTAVNDQFKYPRYFSMNPLGPTPKIAFTHDFFEIAKAQKPRPENVALIAADVEFGRTVCDGARENAKNAGFKIVYDRTYPLGMPDMSPIVRSVQATNAEVVVICSLPIDSVGLIRAVNEIGYKPKMIGGGMVGVPVTTIKTLLGPLLNGFINYDLWLPVKGMQYPGVMELIEKYQARAKNEGTDPIGFYNPPWAYAYLQVLAQAVEGTKSLDDAKLAEYMHAATFKTVVGDIKFGPNGEWTEPRILTVQYRDITSTNVNEFRDVSKMTILAPSNYKSGDIVYPFADARR
jgi:branched-chain amino acid transport system substrate-binding protein